MCKSPAVSLLQWNHQIRKMLMQLHQINLLDPCSFTLQFQLDGGLSLTRDMSGHPRIAIQFRV